MDSLTPQTHIGFLDGSPCLDDRDNLTVLIVIFWRKVTDRLPGPLMAILFTTLILVRWLGWPLETIGSRFGTVPNTFPMPHFPHINLDILD